MSRRTIPKVLALAVLWLALGREAAAQDTIRYVQPPEPIYVTQGRYDLDFNWQELLDIDGDGIADYRFSGDIFSVRVQALGDNRQLSLPAIPPDSGSYLFPLPFGASIGYDAPADLEWIDRFSPRHGVPGQSAVSGCADTGCGGLFLGITAFMGVQFASAEGMHFGWVRIEAPSFEAGGIILDWAYETRPDVPILAGAVPEPSTWALLIGGGMLIALFRRKKMGRKG